MPLVPENSEGIGTPTTGGVVVGNVAAGAADAGAPVKVGGITQTTQPTLADGQRGDMQISTRGEVLSQMVLFAAVGTDGVSNTLGWAVQQGGNAAGTIRLPPSAYHVFNGTTWDRLRLANVYKTVQAQAIVAGTGITIWTPTGGKKFRVLGYSFSSTVAAGLILGDNVAATVIFRGPILAANGIDTKTQLGNGILSAAANNVLKLDVSVGATVTGSVWGTEE